MCGTIRIHITDELIIHIVNILDYLLIPHHILNTRISKLSTRYLLRHSFYLFNITRRILLAHRLVSITHRFHMVIAEVSLCWLASDFYVAFEG